MLRAILVSLAVTVSVLAQQSETIEVQLTNLDVVVTDAKGAKVSGLTKADFEILENGAKREITNISEIRRAAGSDVQATPPRRVLVAIDNRTIPQSARRKTIAALRQTIDQLLGSSSDRLTIVTIAGSSQTRLPWTNDRAAISQVLDAIEKEPAMPRLENAEIENMFGDLIQTGSSAGPKSSALSAPRPAVGGNSGNTGSNDRDDAEQSMGNNERLAPAVDYNLMLTRARAFAGSAQAETRQTLGALGSSLNLFSAAPGGRRLVVLVGGALPLFPGSDLFQRLDAAIKEIESHQRQTSMSAKGQNQLLTSPMMEKTSFDVTKNVDALANSARMKGIAFYAVNPETNEHASQGSNSRHLGGAGSNFAALNASIDGFQRLAFATGGASHVGRSAEVALTDIQSDLDTYYSIGYRSTTPLTPETKIVVKTKPGHTTRATIAAAAVSPEWQIGDSVLTHHFSEPSSNDLGISLVPELGMPDASGTRKMVVRVMIPFDRLTVTKQGSDYLCSFSVFVSVGDAAGGAPPQQETKDLKWNAETVEKLRGRSIAYGVNLTVGPGRDRVSVGMLDRSSGRTGFAKAVLQ